MSFWYEVIALLFMMLWHYFTGYLIIRIDGLSLEKFINISVNENLHLWGVERITYTTLRVRMSIFEFKKLHIIFKMARCKLHIEDKLGLPFILHRLKKRKMLIIGAVICVLLLYICTSFIWVIDVSGTKKVKKETIMNILRQNGVKVGTQKSYIHKDDLENQMMIDIPELSWIGFELKGIKLIVKVVEAVIPPSFPDKSTPCNIISVKDCMIAKIIVLEGNPQVKISDTVKKGQILISGIIQHDEANVRYVHANGEVLGRVWYESKGMENLSRMQKIFTGGKVACSYLQIGTRKITIKKTAIPFSLYEHRISKKVILDKNLFVPVEMITDYYLEYKMMNQRINLQAARENAQSMAWTSILKLVPQNVKIVDKRVEFSMIEGESIIAKIYVETLEPIGTPSFLSIGGNGQK